MNVGHYETNNKNIFPKLQTVFFKISFKYPLSAKDTLLIYIHLKISNPAPCYCLCIKLQKILAQWKRVSKTFNPFFQQKNTTVNLACIDCGYCGITIQGVRFPRLFTKPFDLRRSELLFSCLKFKGHTVRLRCDNSGFTAVGFFKELFSSFSSCKIEHRFGNSGVLCDHRECNTGVIRWKGPFAKWSWYDSVQVAETRHIWIYGWLILSTPLQWGIFLLSQGRYCYVLSRT